LGCICIICMLYSLCHFGDNGLHMLQHGRL
jgi:hypothetical protein